MMKLRHLSLPWHSSSHPHQSCAGFVDLVLGEDGPEALKDLVIKPACLSPDTLSTGTVGAYGVNLIWQEESSA